MRNTIKQVILEQREIEKGRMILRSFPEQLEKTSDIIVISGIRRCGKSVLMDQIRMRQKDSDYYINFDDERLLHFNVEHFQLLNEVFIELFGVQKFYYFDEIQNIKGWERFVRRLYNSGNKIFITGSNAGMLSRELGTRLTGRYCSYELFPFSFREFLNIRNITVKKEDFITTNGKAILIKQFNLYSEEGGFPVYLMQKNPLYLKSLYESIIYRDVMVRNYLTNEKEILELVYFLAGNVAKLSSYNSLSKIIGVKNATTVMKYIGFIRNTYLIFQAAKFDYSLKKQIQNPKKTYFIDNALVKRLGFMFSDNSGRMLENLVFIELKRRGADVYYYKGKKECDFIIRTGAVVTDAIQVCYLFENEATKKREVDGLLEAMDSYSLNSGLIITSDAEEAIRVKGNRIEVVPAWKWILSNPVL
ncbi:MAG: ATP-binding protein [Bacteroidetes bacterium]|nr:ATP-binding protein [Bacteroidota bacterium]